MAQYTMRGLTWASTGEARPSRFMTSGRKFSTSTSAVATSFLNTSLPSGLFRFRVRDFLLLFWARKLVPMSCWLSLGTLPSLRARSPSVGFSILMTSAPSSARCKVANGPASTLVMSSTRTPCNALRGFCALSLESLLVSRDEIGLRRPAVPGARWRTVPPARWSCPAPARLATPCGASVLCRWNRSWLAEIRSDFGAQQCQVQGGERSRQHVGHVQHPHALQRLAGLLCFVVGIAHG